MVYLYRWSDGAIAVVEDTRRAAIYLRRGYRPCTRAAYLAAWRKRDAAAFMALREAMGLAPAAPAVKESEKPRWRAPWQLIEK